MPRKLLSSLAFLATFAAPAVAVSQETSNPPPQPVAQGVLRAADGSEAGRVTAFRGAIGWLFRVEGQGWPEGWHGTHLHAVGDCAAPGFTSAGGHVNHAGHARPHGLLNTEGGPDLGDLQNVHASADGSALAEVYLVQPGSDGPGDLLDADGTAFVVHANADDHLNQPIGGAGDRIACAVLEPISAATD